MNCPKCQSARVRPLLPIAADERSAYTCRECRAHFLADRRTNTAKVALKSGDRRAPVRPKKLA